MGKGEAEQLTRRECEVAAKVARGLSNRKIAETLFIGVRTAESHVASILDKLGLASRAELVAYVAAGKLEPAVASGNLPEPLSSFIGREWEAATVRSLLGRYRLVTITGAGGIGKSRLALEVARSLASDQTDGPWLIELASISDPRLVATAVMAALGLREDATQPPEATLVTWLRKRKTTLFVDNCEHLLSAVADLATKIVSRSSHVRILATSREPLGVEGEAIVALEGLDLGAAARSSDEAAPAVRLFLDRAQLKRGGYEPPAAEIGHIVSLCRRLDGMPLAIELAAARVGAMTPSEMLARIDQGRRVPVPEGQSRSSSRHATMDAAIDWSYSLLDDDERAVFRALSVFSGFNLEAAGAVCGIPPAGMKPVDDVVLGLVDKSLVLAFPGGQVTRYRLLEPVRQFAFDRLFRAGEADAVLRRHAFHYADIGERAMPAFFAARKRNFWEPILNDLDNFRSALAWSSAHDTTIELRLVTPFWHALGIRSALGEQWAIIEHALSVAPDSSSVRAHVLSLAAWTLMRSGNHEQTEQFAAQQLEIARELHDRKEEIHALWTLSSAQIPISPEKAERTAREVVALVRNDDDTRTHRLGAMALAWALAAAGKVEEATRAFDQSIALTRQMDDLFQLPGLLEGRANLALMQDDCDLAAHYWSEGARVCSELSYRYQLPFCIDGLARVAKRRGELEKSLRLAAAAARIFEENQMRHWGSDRPQQEEWLPQVRRSLSEHVADRAWAEGERMTDDEAIRYALESTSPRSDVSLVRG